MGFSIGKDLKPNGEQLFKLFRGLDLALKSEIVLV